MQARRVYSTSSKTVPVLPPALPGWKRAIDLAFCCVALPFLAIATFFVAALMSVTSPGPIFFRQERVGYLGRRFRLYKFRTMHVGADTANHQAHFTALMTSNAPMQKLDAKGDSRLIPLGWLIRAAGIDELPQIINVLKGEMSVIGPRPCIPYEYQNYTAQQRLRCQAAPGLTGLWQVSGKNRTTFERMIQLDVQYAAEKSLGMDLKILALTIPAVLRQISDILQSRRNHGKGLAEVPATTAECKPIDLGKPAPSGRVT
jgi:exopolysaccharide production protein ExoY